MKTRWKICLAVTIFLGIFIGIWAMTMHVGPEHEVAAYKKELRDRGEKLQISEVMPAPVMAESNGMETAEMAFKALGNGGVQNSEFIPTMKMIAPGRAMIGWMQPVLGERTAHGYSNSWENAESLVESVHTAMDLLRQAAGYQAFDFHLEYEKGPETLLPHLRFLKAGARTLSARAMCDLHHGNTGSAVTNICAILVLARAMHGEAMDFSQFVRMTMVSVALSANWEVLQSTNITEAELVMLQKDWENLEFIHAIYNAELMQRATMDHFFVGMQASISEFYRLLGIARHPRNESFEDYWRRMGRDAMWETSWKYANELRYLQNLQDILETLRTVNTNQYFEPAFGNLQRKLDSSTKANTFDDSVSDFLETDFNHLGMEISLGAADSVHRVMLAEISQHLVIAAIALKRFQLKHGEFPMQLSELVPEFVATVPTDAVDGRPLRYRRNPDGTFALYSIGENMTDDGGNPNSISNLNARNDWMDTGKMDWVWPQPATPAEVEKYYKDRAERNK